MSGMSWLKIEVIPAPLLKHATHLKYKVTTLQEFANSKNQDDKLKKTVHWLYIEPFVVSVMKLAERVLN